MSLKYSPGPWKVIQKAVNSLSIVDSEGFEVASIYNDSGEYVTQEERNNAQFIAMTPELLEALIDEFKNYFIVPVEMRKFTLYNLKAIFERVPGLEIEEILK